MGLFDLHCHLLPGIDDGKVSADGLTRFLAVYRECGFDGLAFTPHVYNPYVTSDVAGIRGEWANADLLCSSLGLKAYLGSEVFVGNQKGLSGIPIAGRYLLVEFPTTLPPPLWLERLKGVKLQGLVPLIAHVERYQWLTPQSQDLSSLKALGALLQVNVEGVEDESAVPYLDSDMVDVVATDNHGPDETLPVRLMSILEKWPEVADRMSRLEL